MRLMLLGAAGFGAGGVVLYAGFSIIGFLSPLAGAVGGAALGLAFRDRETLVTLALLGALGAAIGFLLAVGIKDLSLAMGFPIGNSQATMAAVTGATTGAALGVAFRDWKRVVVLGVAGAVGFGLGGAIAGESPSWLPAAGIIGGATVSAAIGLSEIARARPRGEILLRFVAVVGAILVGGVVLIVGIPTAVLVLPYTLASMTACNAEERAVFEEFPQYGGIEKEPEPFAESGGCAVFYDTPDPQERVAEYYARQLKAHGWKVEKREGKGTIYLEEQNKKKTIPTVEVMARRGDFSYEVLFESHEIYSPPGPGAHVAVHVARLSS